jgi:hypothetical protein
MTTLAGKTYHEISNGTLPEGLVSEPPNYPRCVVTLERAATKSPLGHAREDSSELLTKCRQLNEAVEEYAVSYLVQTQQVLHIARELDISPTAAQVTQRFKQVKAQTYNTPRALSAYLASSHTTVPNLLLEAKLDLIGEAYLAKVKSHAEYIAQQNRWIKRTTCKARYAVEGCSDARTTPASIPPPSILLKQVAATITGSCADRRACAKQAGL